MTSRPIVFVDTETTCLGPLARPWEIAVIRREPDGGQTESVIQVTYTLQDLPTGTSPQALHIGGWLLRGAAGSSYIDDLPVEIQAMAFEDEAPAARTVHNLLAGDPVLIGVGVHFDAAVLSSMFRRHDRDPEPWHYGLIDLKAATWGNICAHVASGGRHLKDLVDLPAASERLALAAGVEPPSDEERHTALGDARWAARWFDALMSGAA